MKPCKKFIKQSAKEFRVDQGDIYSNISFFKCIDISSGNLNLNKLDFANVLVLSQTFAKSSLFKFKFPEEIPIHLKKEKT